MDLFEVQRRLTAASVSVMIAQNALSAAKHVYMNALDGFSQI